MAIEYELKFRATEATLNAIDASFADTPAVYHMQTTYYDTRDRALSARHITLRRRMENEISVCTLKAPADLGRAEYELNCDSIEKVIPELCKLSGVPGLADLLEDDVEPVCGARFTRRARTVRFMDTTLELALDMGVLLGGGKEQPLCEVEVELKEGEPKHAAAYAARLALAYGLEQEKHSKFKRAMTLAQGE